MPYAHALSLVLLCTCAAVSGCTGAISDVGGEQLPGRNPAADPDVEYAPGALLTAEQYRWAVFDLLGVTPSARLPRANQSDLFENNSLEHIATERSTNVHAEIATEVAESVSTEALLATLGCDADCSSASLRPFFRRAFRRNLPAAETDRLVRLLEDQPSVEAGLRMLLEVVLLSPQFVYRFESGMNLGGPGLAPGLGELDDFSLASRLSFFFWSSIPDDELLDLAEESRLNHPEVLGAEVDRMMSDPRFERTVTIFHEQWLDLGTLSDTQKAGSFAGFTDLGEDWKQSLDATIVHSFESGLSGLLTGNEYFLTEALAETYGFEATGGLDSYMFDPSERAGLLTHPAMMAKLSHSDQDSPVQRGVFVLRRLFCSEPPAPPDGVDLTPPAVDEDSTTRERFETLTGVEPCNTCHQSFNPIGFLFSKYDAAGRFADANEAGRMLDSAATLRGLGSVAGDYQDAVALSEALAESAAVRDCVAGHWFRFAIGRPVSDRDVRSLYEANSAFQESEGDFRALMRAVATGPAFRLYRAEEE